MKHYLLLTSFLLLLNSLGAQISTPANYLLNVIEQMNIQWPKNRTINLVFHGHSVPAGYWNDHRVETLQSYPFLTLQALKDKYPYALINVIVTAKGGENSENGQQRFNDVLAHKPDVLFIDYALNDVSLGLTKSREAWGRMITEADSANIKVILFTPSPDQRVNLADSTNVLDEHARQIRELAKFYKVGLVDSYLLFKNVLEEKGSIKSYMSWVNHPNKDGHALIMSAIIKHFGL